MSRGMGCLPARPPLIRARSGWESAAVPAAAARSARSTRRHGAHVVNRACLHRMTRLSIQRREVLASVNLSNPPALEAGSPIKKRLTFKQCRPAFGKI
jgi:hypothetical protein